MTTRLLLAAVWVSCLSVTALNHSITDRGVDAPYKVLVFSKTAGFRHSSIPKGVKAIQILGAANNFRVIATEDASAFTGSKLAQFQTVMFISTTGDVLNESQQAAFEAYIRQGGGYVGVHAASDTEYDWPFYGTLVGAWFASHPAIQQASIDIEDPNHPATAHLPARWTRTDEWYNFRSDPRATAHILMTLNEASYYGGTMGDDHPITWCKTIGGGRTFYTALGHTEESFATPISSSCCSAPFAIQPSASMQNARFVERGMQIGAPP